MARSYTLKTPDLPDDIGIDFEGELNPQQYAAVSSPPGQALVLAGAGSGKTRTLTYRVAYLIAKGVAAKNILLLTFTNKAAREMTQRVDELLPGQTLGLWSGTFHSICNRMLRRHADVLGYSRSFSILDSEDQRAMLAKIIKQNKIAEEIKAQTGEKLPKPQVIGGIISMAANTQTSLDEILEQNYAYFEEMKDSIKKIAKLYRKKKRESNAMDFDDLLIQMIQVLKKDETIRDGYQGHFQHLLVDEYQDTNAVQSELIDLLAGPSGNIMVVGDDAQSIYSWRGANFENIIKFPDRYPGAQVFKIETNYRSVPEVLELANQAIRSNSRQFKKELAPARPSKEALPGLIALPDSSLQASFVTQRIHELHDEEGMDYESIAVLYRSHFQSMDLQMQLTQWNVPFTIVSGLRFFEQAHIKDATAFMRFAVNRLDETAFDRMINLLPGIGPATATRLWREWSLHPNAQDPTATFSPALLPLKVPARTREDWVQLCHVLDEFIDENGKFVKPSNMLISILDGVYDDYMRQTFDNYESRKQDVDQLSVFAERYEDVEAFLAEMALLTTADGDPAGDKKDRKREKPKPGVMLSSVHQAKGLEWEIVFVIGLTDGGFPNFRAIEDGGKEALEEERRLFYVAVTRAQDELYLTYPQIWRKPYGVDVTQEPSRFLREIPEELLETWDVGGPVF